MRWRANQRQVHVDERILDRIAERERIARELHDGLLQEVVSLVLRVDASLQALPPGHAARRQIEDALEHSEDVVAQTRDQVLQLRCRPPQGELATALEQAIRRRRPSADSDSGAAFAVTVTGCPRPLAMAAWAELYGIGLEAVTNALRHAQAARIVSALDYRRDALVLSVRDDGIGVARDVLDHGGPPDHCGLRSMRERAALLGRRLELRTRATGGPIVAVRVASRVAYRTPFPGPAGAFRTLQRASGGFQD